MICLYSSDENLAGNLRKLITYTFEAAPETIDYTFDYNGVLISLCSLLTLTTIKGWLAV